MALGAMEVTPIELVTGYAPFANGGFRVYPRLVTRIQAADGTLLWSSETRPPERVMDPRDAYQVTSMLQSVVNYGTGKAVRDAGARGLIAGKTGTTNNGADVWFVGYTPTVVAGFWFGFDKPAPIGGNASGGRLVTPAWTEFYLNGWREQASPNAWAPPAGMSARTIDPTTGYVATEWCPVRQADYFKPGTEPNTPCPEHDPNEEYYDDQQQASQDRPRDWNNDFGKKLGKALEKIFRF